MDDEEKLPRVVIYDTSSRNTTRAKSVERLCTCRPLPSSPLVASMVYDEWTCTCGAMMDSFNPYTRDLHNYTLIGQQRTKTRIAPDGGHHSQLRVHTHKGTALPEVQPKWVHTARAGQGLDGIGFRRTRGFDIMPGVGEVDEVGNVDYVRYYLSDDETVQVIPHVYDDSYTNPGE